MHFDRSKQPDESFLNVPKLDSHEIPTQHNIYFGHTNVVALFCLTKMHQSLQTGQFLDFLPIDAFRRQNVRYAAGRRGLRDVPIAGHSRWCIVPSRRHSALLCCDRSRLVPMRRQNQGDELSAVEPVPSEEPLLVGTASVVETNVGNVIGRQVIDLWRKQELGTSTARR